jgi:hypothetical protein
MSKFPYNITKVNYERQFSDDYNLPLPTPSKVLSHIFLGSVFLLLVEEEQGFILRENLTGFRCLNKKTNDVIESLYHAKTENKVLELFKKFLDSGADEACFIEAISERSIPIKLKLSFAMYQQTYEQLCGLNSL